MPIGNCGKSACSNNSCGTSSSGSCGSGSRSSGISGGGPSGGWGGRTGGGGGGGDWSGGVSSVNNYSGPQICIGGACDKNDNAPGPGWAGLSGGGSNGGSQSNSPSKLPAHCLIRGVTSNGVYYGDPACVETSNPSPANQAPLGGGGAGGNGISHSQATHSSQNQDVNLQHMEQESARLQPDDELRLKALAEWAASHPLEAAEMAVNEAESLLQKIISDKKNAERLINENNEKINSLLHEIDEANNTLIRDLGKANGQPRFWQGTFRDKAKVKHGKNVTAKSQEINQKNNEISNRKIFIESCDQRMRIAHDKKLHAQAQLADIIGAVQSDTSVTQSTNISQEETLSKSAQEVKAQVKQTINLVGQDIASTAGKAAGVAVAGLETIVGIKKAVEDPIGAVKSVYNLATTDDKLKKADAALTGIFAHIKLEENKGTIPGAFAAGFEKSKLNAEVLSGIFGGIGVAKAGVSASGKIGEKLSSLFAPSPKYPTVKLADTKIEWGGDISKQGLPWEDFLEPKLAPKSRLVPDFKTFDFFDGVTGLATSAKTFNSATVARISAPKEIYKKTKSYIDETIKFKEYSLGPDHVKAEWINERHLQLAIPKTTTAEQFEQLERAIQYGESVGVKVFVTLVD
ncbi:hypothetical protein [Acerihabitans sp.]|uniref:endonuclease toxin domain-containing protein n=1 Tax=Acerihabitans sp. TaxID=2811394 RepID=UPI002ED85351